MSVVKNQETKNDRLNDTGTIPLVEAVIFSQTEIRKKDFIQFVLVRNDELASCYQNAAQRIRGSGQKKLLSNMLTRKKEVSEKLIQKLGQTEYSSSHTTGSIMSSAVQYMLDSDLRPVTTIIDVFIFMMKKEQKDLELFGRLADLEENVDVKEIFLQHTRVCKEHIGLLEVDFATLTVGPS
jgi:rubrerythrin